MNGEWTPEETARHRDLAKSQIRGALSSVADPDDLLREIAMDRPVSPTGHAAQEAEDALAKEISAAISTSIYGGPNYFGGFRAGEKVMEVLRSHDLLRHLRVDE